MHLHLQNLSYRYAVFILSDVEQSNLSLLDITKHAVKTIIESMQKQDMMSIVSFHTTAKVEISEVEMTNAGKKKVKKALDE